VDLLAVSFIVCRALHAAFYIANMPVWRSHAWRLGMICVVGLFMAAATQGRP
jgi:uncharacterized MAPEG superfamily protein